MKKLGKSFSFLTKIMLVIGLLISNLSSLSVVFASEVKLEVNVVDDKLYIEYLDELADDVKSVKVKVSENFTYLDDTYYKDETTALKGKVSYYELSFNEEELENDTEIPNEDVVVGDTVLEDTLVENTDDTEEIVVEENSESVELDSVVEDNSNVELEEDELENTDDVEEEIIDKEVSLVVDTILPKVIFDGIYEVTVEIIDTTNTDDEKLIETQDYSMAVLHDSGLEFAIVDAITGEEVELLEDGRYAVDYTNPRVNVVARLLSGGIKPTDMFLVNEEEYDALALLAHEFVGSEFDFSGRLFGDYTLPVVVELSKYNVESSEYELIQFSEEELKVNVLYGKYEYNTLAMNNAAEELELAESYLFNGTTKNGVVYVLLDENKVNTMYDLYSIVNYMFEDDEYITYLLGNSEYEDILSLYDEETATVDFEEYLKGIKLDDNTLLSLVNDGLTVTYKVVIAGDFNNDNKLTNDDLLDLINQVVGDKEVNVQESDLYELDGKVNTLDVMYLDQVIKNDNWSVELSEQLENSIITELQVVETDIVSGQEFTVNYIVKLSDYMINGVAGLFTYDEDVLELKSVKTANEWLGNSKDGKFLYVGEESLELPVIEETEEDLVEPEIPEVEDETNAVLVVTEDTNADNSELTTEEDVVVTKDYVVVSATFTAKKAGTHTINVVNREFFNQDIYYGVEEEPVSVEVLVNASDNNNLSTLVVAGQEIVLEKDKYEYEITVGSEVTTAEVVAMVQNVAANITSIVSPEELVEGENVVTVTVTAENGDVKVYSIKVIREEVETTTQVAYDNTYEENNDEEEEFVVTTPEEEIEEEEITKEESNLSRIIIIILILLVIAGLIYLIFKDEDDTEIKKVNKDVNNLRKEEKIPEIKKEKKLDNKPNNNEKNKNLKNKKKER